MRQLMIAALLAAAPAGAFAQMLPADLQSIDHDEVYNVNTANGVSADHAVRPHLIGDIKPRSVRVAGHTVVLVESSTGDAAAAEPAHPGS